MREVESFKQSHDGEKTPALLLCGLVLALGAPFFLQGCYYPICELGEHDNVTGTKAEAHFEG